MHVQSLLYIRCGLPFPSESKAWRFMVVRLNASCTTYSPTRALMSAFSQWFQRVRRTFSIPHYVPQNDAKTIQISSWIVPIQSISRCASFHFPMPIDDATDIRIIGIINDDVCTLQITMHDDLPLNLNPICAAHFILFRHSTSLDSGWNQFFSTQDRLIVYRDNWTIYRGENNDYSGDATEIPKFELDSANINPNLPSHVCVCICLNEQNGIFGMHIAVPIRGLNGHAGQAVSGS